MARARNIKPALYKNERLAECSIWARFIFPGLWMLADRSGRLEDRPRRIGSELLPYDNEDVDKLLDELVQGGMISRYQIDENRYIQVLKFDKHQRPHYNETASAIPPQFSVGSTVEVSDEEASNNHGSAQHVPKTPDSLNPSLLKPDSPISVSAGEKRAAPSTGGDGESLAMFGLAWNAYPKRPGASRADTFRKWTERAKSGASLDLMLAGVKRYAAYVAENAVEPKYIKQPSTFFGPGEHYLADWSSIEPKAAEGTAVLGKSGRATALNAMKWLEGKPNASV